MADRDTRQQEQIEKAERLQDLLLDHYETRLASGTITPTEVASLQRLLLANGWNLDPARVPEGLKDMLTSRIDPRELDDEDDDVLPLRRYA